MRRGLEAPHNMQVRACKLRAPYNMQVRPVFTQVGTGFLYGDSVVCGQTCRSDARSAGGEYTGFLARCAITACAPKKCKESVFETQIL